MSTRRSARLRSSPCSLVLGAKRRRVEFDEDENPIRLAPTPGSVDDQVPIEDLGSEEDLASIMDELFDLEHGEALISPRDQPAPTSCPEASISETAPPMGAPGNNMPRAASWSSALESKPVEWVKTLLNKLRDNRWSASRIVVYWLGLQGGGRGLRQKKKADELADILLEQEDFFSSVTRHPKIQRWAMEDHVPKVVTDELDQMRATTKIFGKFDPDTSAIDVGLLLDAAGVVERDAPQLSSLVRRICSVKDHRLHTRGRMASIVSTLQLARHRETANFFARSLGLYLKDLGLKRRGIQVLHGLGLIDSYHTLQSLSEGLTKRAKDQLLKEAGPTNVVIFDNFEYQENTRHQIVGDNGTFHSHTTGLLIPRGHGIPDQGLRRDMLRMAPIKPFEFLSAEGNECDSTEDQLSNFFIFEAIRNAFKYEVDHIFDSRHNLPHRLRYPQLPVIDVIEVEEPTYYTPLGPILTSESTIDDIYQVLENIYLRQLRFDAEKNFEDRLFLAYGDQKTSSLIRSCKALRNEEPDQYESYKWVLPVPGLWHLRLNYLYMVMKIFNGGGKHSDDPSSLFNHINILKRRNIPIEKAPFQHLEELMLHSFDARVVALFLVKLRDTTRLDLRSPEQVAVAIKALRPVQIWALVDEVRSAAFGWDIIGKANKIRQSHLPKKKGSSPTGVEQLSTLLGIDAEDTPDPMCDVDVEFLTHVRFLQAVKTYKVLKYSIQCGDIGLLRRSVVQSIFHFSGTSHKRYSQEMLYFWWITSSSASDPVLQRAILANSLVTSRKKREHFMEADKVNELFNLELKETLRMKRTSTFGVVNLFKQSVLMSKHASLLRDIMEEAFGEATKNDHTVKSAAADIRSLAHLLAQSSLVYSPSRTAGFDPAPAFTFGKRNLNDRIDSLNLHILHGMCTANEDDPEDDNVVFDEEPDLGLVGLEVQLLGQTCTPHC